MNAKNGSSIRMDTSSTGVKPLTTYLGTLLKEAGVPDITKLPYNGKQVDYSAYPSIHPMSILGRYEAGLTQASYMSRISYMANVRKLSSINFINHNPTVFNTALSIMRRNINLSDEVPGVSFNAKPFVGYGTVLYNKSKTHETPCYFQIIDYTNHSGPSAYPGERVLYVTFRGTLSMKSAFLTDANITTYSVTELLSKCAMEGMTGLDAFSEDISNAENYRFAPGIHPFGIHQGFVLNLRDMIGDICNTLEEILLSIPIHRIVVTGHSLGGANATVASLIFAGFKRAGVKCLQEPKLHCITFGSPKLFLDYTRHVYNRHLNQGILTLDRVAGRMGNLVLGMASAGTAIDLVPTIPPNLVHPGYMILKQEIKTQSRTGRSKNISDIRQMFGDSSAVEKPGSAMGKLKSFTLGAIKSYSEFNGLPYYMEFLNCFETVPGITQESYEKKFMNLPFATVYKVPGADNVVYEGIKQLVMQVLGKPLNDSDFAKDSETVKEEPPLNIQLNEENTIAPNSPQSGGFSFVSKLKKEYESSTLMNGPNHVVYSCKKNISPFTCHLAYMGVGYGGVSAGDIGYSPPTRSEFIVSDRKIAYVVPSQQGGRKKTRSVRKVHKKLQRKTRRYNRK
jgi:hypothetical protein